MEFNDSLKVDPNDVVYVTVKEPGYSVIKSMEKNTFFSRENLVMKSKIPRIMPVDDYSQNFST
jgi:hypothetical protein